jgi:small subunit ribosomal protein S6
MREYELVFIVHPDLDTSAFNEVVERVQGWITDEGGKVVKTDVWGKKPLAYPIRKKSEGQYVVIDTELPPAAIRGIERNLNLLEPVMRFLIAGKE